MRKLFGTGLIGIALSMSLFAGGQSETGRAQVLDSINEGQLISTGSIDPKNYLTDFACELKNTGDQPLQIDIDLLKDTIWESGDDISLRISLSANTQDYFKNIVSGDFIFYFQNPELLKQQALLSYLDAEVSKYRGVSFYAYDAVNDRLVELAGKKATSDSLSALSAQTKLYETNIVLRKLLSTISGKEFKNRVHVMWITDENIAESASDANFFKFAMNVLSTAKTTFSYLGYGETPNWTILNNELMQLNGNTYFGKTYSEITEKITSDIRFFAKPSIEDININIKWSKYVKELATFYPPQIYGNIGNFTPSVNNERPKTKHYSGGMNYSETKRYLHYARIPSLYELCENEYVKNLNDSKFVIGTVFVDYYVPQMNRRLYFQKPISIRYVNQDQTNDRCNEYVYKDTIIQNTPLIILEVANIVNKNRNKDYLTAIQLINVQKNLLTGIKNEDKAVLQDIGLLGHYYDILFEQAKIMNLIQ